MHAKSHCRCDGVAKYCRHSPTTRVVPLPYIAMYVDNKMTVPSVAQTHSLSVAVSKTVRACAFRVNSLTRHTKLQDAASRVSDGTQWARVLG